MKVVKNKLAPPFRSAEFDILFDQGISRIGSILDLGVERNIIDKKGSWLSFNTTRLGQGREAARDELKKNPALLAEIEKCILASVEKEPVPKKETANDQEFALSQE